MPENWLALLTNVYYAAVAVLIVSILLDNRNPTKTAGYILMLIFLPVIGLIIYIMFGRDIRKRKLFSRKGIRDNLTVNRWISDHHQLLLATKDQRVQRLGDINQVSELLSNSNAFMENNNHAKVLNNGDSTFEEIKLAIQEAQHHIHLEYYIIEDDPVTREIFTILKEKAGKGVSVRIIYDDVGSSSLPGRTIRALKASGVQIYPFMPVRFPHLTGNANYRNHRKIIVIDGLTGFLGGINLSQRYSNRVQNQEYWRDTHLRIDGAVVRQLQIQFMLMWDFVSGESLPIQISFFPQVPTYSNLSVQLGVSGPDSDWAYLMMAFFKAINVASKYVYITTPYFIPNEQILTAIQSAALSGIDVQLIIPKKADSRIVQAATMSYVKDLLRAGARVFLYEKGFVHSKTMVVDGLLGTVGTANMDQRSFDINFEINAFVYNDAFSRQLTEIFIEDKKDCSELFLVRWEKRKISRRIAESAARLLAPLL